MSDFSIQSAANPFANKVTNLKDTNQSTVYSQYDSNNNGIIDEDDFTTYQLNDPEVIDFLFANEGEEWSSSLVNGIKEIFANSKTEKSQLEEKPLMNQDFLEFFTI